MARKQLEIMHESPRQMLNRARWAARRIPLPVGVHYPTPVACDAMPDDDSIFSGAGASYDPLTSIEIDDPDNLRKQNIGDALDKLADWGWSNTVDKVDKIETAQGCKELILKALGKGAMAPWFNTDVGIWEITFLGVPFCLAPRHAIAAFAWELLLRWGLSKPTAFRLVLLSPDSASGSLDPLAELILEEALHHEYYPYFGPCFECEADHYGIEVAKIITNYIKVAPTFLMDLTPKIDPTPAQARLDAVEQILKGKVSFQPPN